MDRKDIIIIILSLIIIAFLAIGAYNQAREDQIIYHTVNITDTFSLDVPISDNVTKTQVSEHMHIVNDAQNGIEITSLNLGNESAMDLIEDGSQYLYTQENNVSHDKHCQLSLKCNFFLFLNFFLLLFIRSTFSFINNQIQH